MHGLGYSSDECNVLVDFGYKYAKIRSTKDIEHNHTNRNKFNRQQENNDIVNSAVDEIFLHQKKK